MYLVEEVEAGSKLKLTCNGDEGFFPSSYTTETSVMCVRGQWGPADLQCDCKWQAGMGIYFTHKAYVPDVITDIPRVPPCLYVHTNLMS
jgi:hypothetical protein